MIHMKCQALISLKKKKQIKMSSGADMIGKLTLSSLQTNTDAFANSADPDKIAHNEPSHQELHCLPVCY